MEHLDVDYEFRDICSDLERLYDRAESLRSQIGSAKEENLAELCAKYTIIQDCIIEGTQSLQNCIYNLDRFGVYKVSQLGATGSIGLTIKDAMGDEDLVFESDSLRCYEEWRDEYED